MRRAFIVQLIAAVLIVTAASDAGARRRIRMPFIVGGGAESIVKVVDLPDIPILKRKDGKYVDLGYRHFSTGGGEWVGYVGSSGRHLHLTPPMLKGLMVIGGLDKLPPPPKRSAASTAMGSLWWVLLGVGALAIFWKVLGMVRGRSAPAPVRRRRESPPHPRRRTTNPATAPPWQPRHRPWTRTSQLLAPTHRQWPPRQPDLPYLTGPPRTEPSQSSPAAVNVRNSAAAEQPFYLNCGSPISRATMGHARCYTRCVNARSWLSPAGRRPLRQPAVGPLGRRRPIRPRSIPPGPCP